MQITRVDQLTQAFRDIASADMEGLAVMNHSLRVEAVGFTPWEGRVVGVLIAPWFMNLVLLPGPDESWDELKDGSKAVWGLPSGEYEFTVARLDPIGVYQSCALFSSVLDFPDQATARAVAQTVMRELLANEEDMDGPSPKPNRNDRLQQGLSRRGLLRRTLGRS